MELSLLFEAGELEIIETFEFDEEIQRPEELRFFTLEEQLTDYFQRVLPKKAHVSKTEKIKIMNEVDRIGKLYEDLVVLGDTDYRINTERRPINVSWLKPIYGGFDYETYSYAQKLLPLQEPAARRTPNGYPILLAALPRPYRSEGTEGVPIVSKTTLVNDENLEDITALGNYVRTKSVTHDDGTLEVLNIPVSNTGDDIRRVGFFIEDRPLDIPHPLMDHPFLSSSKSSKIMTVEPLMDVFPTIEAIMSHAIPVTKDPYVDGRKYLKVYDIQLSEIPWKSWKERFPPVDTINSQPPVLSVVFPISDDVVAPSEKLQKVYDSKWSKSVYPRLWLMSQEDGGKLVMKMLLSDAGEFGLLPPDLINDRPRIQLPESTPSECLVTDTFEQFLASGVYRRPGVCAPTTFVTQERAELLNKGKVAWTETTQTNIQKEYIALLKFYNLPKDTKKDDEYEKFKAGDVSELAENVLVILKDPSLLPPDKSYNIRMLIKELTPVKNVFVDVNGLKVICSHTLSQLDGDMEADRLGFYTKWTTLFEGYRVCKSCGEQINADSYVAQEDYDDEGRMIVSHDILTDSTFHGDTHPANMASSLAQLKNAFNLNNAGESIMYLLLNQLQIMPNESQLVPILGNMRKVSLAASRKLPSIEKNKVDGLLGISGMVVLLQIHNPFLIPRRSFGNRVIKLSGFPRDTDDSESAPVLTLLLNALKELLEAFPTSFKEPLSTIMREISVNRKKVRDQCIKFIQQAYTEFKPQFEAAKERAETVMETVAINTILLPDIMPKKIDFKPGEKQGTETFGECSGTNTLSIIYAKLKPSVSQTSPDFWKSKPSDSATYIMPQEIKIQYSFPQKKEIEKTVKTGFSKTLRLELIRKFVESDTDGIALLSLLSRLLDILAPLKFPSAKIIEYRKFIDNVNTFENKSLFRDAVKGQIYELIDSIKSEAMYLETIRTAMTRDLDMNMILLTKEDSERVVELLRARERETLKERLRTLGDKEREAIKMLMDIGIAQYIIYDADRQLLAKEFQVREEIADEEKNLEDIPEDGFTNRDYVDGDEQLNVNNQPIEVDSGDYGDVRDRPADDYSRDYDFDETD